MRRKAGGRPARPHSAAELDIPEAPQTTYGGANFVLWDSGMGDDNRMVLFGTDVSLSWLEAYPRLLADGCFDVSPAVCLQVYTAHAMVGGSAFPCFYALMVRKDEGSFRAMLGKLKELRPALNPGSVLTDFEMAARNAFRRSFPGVVLGGCFFHLRQSVWRRAQSSGGILMYFEGENY